MNDPIVVERTCNAPLQKVWKALTDLEQIKQWYFNIAAFEPVVDFEFTFEGRNEERVFIHHCKITEVVPNQKLAYTWRYEGYPGDSLVVFELFEEDGQTTVKLTHTGVDTFPATDDFKRENFVQGWTHIIGTGLKEYVEK